MSDSTPTPDIAEDLAACPFCGGEPLEHRVLGLGKLWRIVCKDCDAGPHSSLSIEQARIVWNTRPTPPKVAGDAEEVIGRLGDLTCDASSVRVVEQAIALILTQAAELATMREALQAIADGHGCPMALASDTLRRTFLATKDNTHEDR
jgi:hypothetical protein